MVIMIPLFTSAVAEPEEPSLRDERPLCFFRNSLALLFAAHLASTCKMGTIPDQEAPPRKRRKPNKPEKVPEWERARSFVADKREKASLPVIQQDGEVKRLKVQRPKFTVKSQKKKTPPAPSNPVTDAHPSSASARTDVDSKARAGRSKANRRKKPTKTLEDYAKKIEDFEMLKTKIAAIASKVVANPEDNVALLKELRKMYHEHKGKSAALVILTESQLFKDIAPAYRIRGITEKEAEVKVSKDVAKLRTYEQTLLSSYQRYVKSCISLSRWRSGGTAETEASRNMGKVRLAACKALTELIRALPHFNEADAIAICVCSLVTDREEIVRRQCADALKIVLGDAHRASGQTLNICVLIAKQLATVAVGKIHAAPAEVVEPLAEIQFAKFARLPLSKKAKNAPKKSKRYIKKRRRKPEKEEEAVDETEIERDLREADAEATPEELYSAKKKLLDYVCHCYFNVIKAASNNTDRVGDPEQNRNKRKKPPMALSPALKGLLRVASFISTDVIEAIIGALTPLLETGRLPLVIRFRCLSAAYAVLGVHARTLQADPDSFTGDTRAMDTSLYTALGSLYGKDTPAKDHEYVTFDAVESILSCVSFREVPLVRCTAIGRRLSILAASSAPTHTCTIGLLRVAQLMLQPGLVSAIYPQKAEKNRENSLGIDSGLIQPYDMTTNDPEIASAERSVAWELSCLTAHFHPTVREIAAKCANGFCGSRLPKTSENILLATKAHQSAKGGFNPPPRDAPLPGSSKKSKKRRLGTSSDAVLDAMFSEEEEKLSFLQGDDEVPDGYFESFWRPSDAEQLHGHCD